MDDHFGVGVGIEAMAGLFEFLAQLGEIVNFAVEHHPDGFVFIVDGLVAAGQVDDAEPAHAQADVVLHIECLHRPDHGGRASGTFSRTTSKSAGLPESELNQTRDSTHVLSFVQEFETFRRDHGNWQIRFENNRELKRNDIGSLLRSSKGGT